MRVLVGCEESGIVRDAFAKLGHDAWSCDKLPSQSHGNHIQDDVMSVLGDGWDIFIGHPPCQYLSYAAQKYWNDPGREEKRQAAFIFFMALYNAPVKHVAIENPMGYPFKAFRKPDQIIHPYYFGDDHMKRTCLWLRGLPKLVHIKKDDLFSHKTHTEKPQPIYMDKSGKRRYFTDSISGSKNGAYYRSKTFPGIAEAMAKQWSEYVLSLRK